jgi:hypothetical protein
MVMPAGRCIAISLGLLLLSSKAIAAPEPVALGNSSANAPVEVAAQFVRVTTPDYRQALINSFVSRSTPGLSRSEAPSGDIGGSSLVDGVPGTSETSPRSRAFAPVLGTYVFKVGWQGIPAATLSLTTEQRGLYYKVSATAKTYSGIDLFYKLRYRAEGVLSSLDFSPVRSSFFSQENSKERLTEIAFLENHEVHTVRSGSKRKTEVLQFDPENNMLEPFSAAFLARSLEWNIGNERSFDTFNGKTRYLITLKCTGAESLEVNGAERSVWVIEPHVLNLTNQRDNGKLRRAQIYVTSDERREVVKITSEVFVGSVSAWLDSFEPDPSSPGAIMAQNEEDNARVLK